MFSIPWSIAAVTETDGREKFNSFFRDLLVGKIEAYPVPESIGSKLELSFPDVGTVHDFCYEVSSHQSIT